MKRDESTKLVNILATALALVEAQRVLNIIVEEGAKEVEGVEVELLNSERHWNVATLIQVRGREDHHTCHVVHDVTLFVDKIAILVDWSALLVIHALRFASSLFIDGQDDVAFFVSVKRAHDINFVEVSDSKANFLDERVIKATCLISSLKHAHVQGAAIGSRRNNLTRTTWGRLFR